MKQISPTTKKYLEFSLNEQIKENKNDYIHSNLIKYKKFYKDGNPLKEDASMPTLGYSEPKKPKEKKPSFESPPSGFGSGQPAKKTKSGKSPSIGNILTGDTDAAGVAGAIGAYGLGSGAEFLGNFLGKSIGNKAIGGVVKTIGGGLSKSLGLKAADVITNLGGQISDVLGVGPFDVNVADIAHQQNRLGVEGAGSPPVQILIPGRRGKQKYEGPEDPNTELRKRVEDEALKRKARKYGLIP